MAAALHGPAPLGGAPSGRRLPRPGSGCVPSLGVEGGVDQTAREWAERTAQEQGLPPRITDPTTLARVAALMDRAEREAS